MLFNNKGKPRANPPPPHHTHIRQRPRPPTDLNNIAHFPALDPPKSLQQKIIHEYYLNPKIILYYEEYCKTLIKLCFMYQDHFN